MARLAWVLTGVYIVGWLLTFHFNTAMAPNATFGLILLRCFVWPIYWTFGWPRGVPLTMD